MAGQQLFIGVTGAQGVGKSSFCRALFRAITDLQVEGAQLLEGLGDQVRARGIPVGSSANPDSVAAVIACHLQRERCTNGRLIILDRCIVDALAYVRKLEVTSPIQSQMYDELCRLKARDLDLVVHLRLSAAFKTSAATHETVELRESVAAEIPRIIAELSLPSLDLDADDHASVDQALRKVLGMMCQRSLKL